MYAPFTINYVIREDYIPREEKNEKKYTVVNFGDSIVGAFEAPTDISTYLEKLIGGTVYNAGFGGCQMSKRNSSTWDPFAMYALADAITSDDWSFQDATDENDSLPNYFKSKKDFLKTIDFSKVDVVTISYGTNDFTAGKALDSENDPDDIETYAGALRYSIEKLLTTFPNLMIYVCSQTYRFWQSEGEFLYDSNTHIINENKLTDFVEKTSAVAKEYNLPFIDNYYSLGFNQFNRSAYFNTNDGTHPKEKGREEIAKNIAKYIR